MWIPVLITSALILIQIKLWQVYKYWTNHGVAQVKPWPIVGSMAPLVFKKCSVAELIQDTYKAFPKKRYYGIYQFFKPTLVVRDPDLIRCINIKNFNTFPEHRVMLPPDIDPLFSNNLFTVRGGQRWQDLRLTLSPCFTNVKLKSIFGLIQQCAEQCRNYYLEEKNCSLNIEVKEMFDKYTNDVISSTAFGVTCNSFENPKNEFYLIGKEATYMTAWKSVKLFMYSLSPLVVKLFKPSILSPTADKFFRSITTESIVLREQQKIVRSDVIHILLEARKSRPDIVLTDEDITANAYIFYLAGFDTTSRALTFTSYELALNLDIQRKLQCEIDRVLENGEVSFDTLRDMKYMDMVVSESLRKWPPIIFTERVSVTPFVIEAERPGEERLVLDSSTDIWFPVFALQRDPKYFPEPEKFDPERFSDTNKHKIQPFTYLPFGVGPRNCIGLRMALLKMKLILFYMLSKFELMPTSKTPIPLVLGKGQLFPNVEGDVWLEFKRRKI